MTEALYDILLDRQVVAAAASLNVPFLSDERALEAAQAIIDAAPEHLKDDFPLCCALYVYRQILAEALMNNSLDVILSAQNHILGIIDR